MPRPAAYPRDARRHPLVPAISVLVALVIGLCDWWGYFDPLDGPLYDTLYRATAGCRSIDARTTLCYLDGETATSPDRMTAIVQSLLEARPLGIAIAVPCEPHLRAALAQLTSPPEANLARADSSPDRISRQPWILTGAAEFDDTQEPAQWPMILSLVADHDAIHRRQQTALWKRGHHLPTLEGAVAMASGFAPNQLPSPFRIAFRGPPGSLPALHTQHIETHQFVPELIQGRVVVLGMDRHPTYLALQTPVSMRNESMTLLEFHGQAINSLLTGSSLQELSPTLRMLVICAVALAGFRIYRHSPFGPGLVTLIAVGLLVILCAAAGLAWFRLWISPASLLIALLAHLLLTWQGEVHRAQQQSRSLCFELLGGGQDVTEQSWIHSTDPWGALENLFRQWLPPCRFVFLSANRAAPWPLLERTHGCGPEEVLPLTKGKKQTCGSEFRACCEQANQEGGPIYLQSRHVIAPRLGESQYLVPLLFRGELLGYVVAAIDDALLSGLGSPLSQLQRLSEEAAEMLQRRRLLHAESTASLLRWVTLGLPWNRSQYVRDLDTWQSMLENARLVTRAMRGKIRRLEAVCGLAPHPTMIFDLFGTVLASNIAMQRVAVQLGHPLSKATPLATLAAITGQSPETFRNQIWHHIPRRSRYSCAGRLPSAIDSFVMHVSPLSVDELGEVDDIYPFQVAAVRVDIIPAIGEGLTDWLCAEESQEAWASNSEATWGLGPDAGSAPEGASRE